MKKNSGMSSKSFGSPTILIHHKSLKKKIFQYILLSAFASVMAITGCKEEVKQEAPVPEVQTFTVITKQVPLVREWVGQTYGNEDIQLRARVDGFLETVNFKEGSTVSKGELLYTINSDELKQRLVETQGKLTEAKTMLVKAKNDVDRYKPLADAGAVSQQRYESAFAYYESMLGTVESAEASVRIAEINLSYATVESPITGVIGISQVFPGDYVTKINPTLLNTISSIDPIKVRFSISEQEYLRLRKEIAEKNIQKKQPDKELEMVLSDGTIYNQKGKLDFANRQIDPSTGTMTLEAKFPNSEKILRPGQYIKVRTDVTVLQDALLIPAKCLMELQGTFNVYVVGQDNKVKLTKVKKGIDYGQFVVIESGLTQGEKVIAEGLLKVKPDMTVTTVDLKIPVESENSGSSK